MSHLHPGTEVELKFYFLGFSFNRPQQSPKHPLFIKQFNCKKTSPCCITKEMRGRVHPQCPLRVLFSVTSAPNPSTSPTPRPAERCIGDSVHFSVCKSSGWLKGFSFQRVNILQVWKSHSEVFLTKMSQVFTPLVTSTFCASCVVTCFPGSLWLISPDSEHTLVCQQELTWSAKSQRQN